MRATAAIEDVQAEMGRQDQVHAGYPPTRDGVRVGLAAAEDELDEAKRAWREGRCKCSEPLCEHHDWTATREEVIQTAAVLLRVAREL